MQRAVTSILIFMVNFAIADNRGAVTLMRKLDAPAPSCDQAADVDVSDDYFVPIGNDLPGMPEYNTLVRENHEQKWPEFEADFRQFQTQFESSPLQEAARYLNANHLFKKATTPDSSTTKEAEKSLREAMLLYPNSDLKPVVLVTAANYWLTTGQFSKALGLFENLRNEYPVHDLSCVVNLGIGESRYFAGDKDGAKLAFTSCLQKCRNRRVSLAARLRLSQMAKSVESLPGQKFDFDALYKTDSQLVSRFFTGALYDYAEKLYQGKNYAPAKYFFDEFLRNGKKDSECVSYARKRLADIAFRKQAPLDEVKSMYLDVYERNPQTDAGLSSKMIALLLDLPTSPPPEQERKILWIDEQIESIVDPNLKNIVYLAKGLFLLEVGNEEALGYLIRLSQKSAFFDLRKGEIASFVREHLLKILRSKGDSIEKQAIKDNDEKLTRDRETETLAEIEDAIGIWLKKSSYEKNGLSLYRQLMISLINSASEKDDLKHLIDLIVRWEGSGLIDKKNFSDDQRAKILSSLTRVLSRSGEPSKLATKYLDAKSVIDGVLGSFANPLWLAVAVEAGDEKTAGTIISSGERLPAAISSRLNGDVREYLNFTRAEALMDKKAAEGEALFRGVKDPKLKKRADAFRFDFFRRKKNFREAFSVGKSLFSESTKDEQKGLLSDLLETGNNGRLWDRSDDLMAMAKASKLPDHDLVPYHLFSGVSLYEKQDYRKAIGELETAISLDQKFSGNAEARFKLGHSLLKVKRGQEARRVWEDLIRQKDPHWSPLAQNELNLLKR